MFFNSVDFIVFFIVVITSIIIIKNRNFQHLFLLFASYLFFYYSSNYLILLLLFTTMWDFYLSKMVYNAKTVSQKKLFLILCVSINLSLLGFFKYADFVITQFNFLGQTLDLGTDIPLLYLALPIGISFYTFHSIGYIVDVYRGTIQPCKSLRDYALFITFFPQLVAGPILRASHFLPQLREKLESGLVSSKLRLITVTDKNLKIGITMIALGLFKKMFFADNIAPLVNDVFANVIGASSLEIWIGTIAFAIQIYCDFSGYSDIALGTALIMGFNIPINFNKPYFATSPSDFWKRWHISLSTWLKDYLYIPLGGNKRSKFRTHFNLIFVMFLGGLWHGASWNFVVWGLLHGAYLSAHQLILNKFPFLKHNSFFNTTFGKIFSILITQYFVLLAWIAFRVEDIHEVVYAMEKFVFLDMNLHSFTNFLSSHKFQVLLILLFLILHFISYRKGGIVSKFSELPMKYWTLMLGCVVFCILFFINSNAEDFIYFRF